MYFPVSWEQLNIISVLALFLFYFLNSLKTDLSMIPKAGKKAFTIAITRAILPSIFIVLTDYFCKSIIPTRFREKSIILKTMYLWRGTSYIVVSCVLANLNLLTSKLVCLAISNQ
ncbi:hypothetical protein KSP39_PZI005859 [Platanthera zijinensis]|uniref:Uncharacterized protein n=1 Tax=Platanthera zijinensis TaxID=2320716 RepID=A0AAP0BS57_9ASPA